MVDAEDKVLSNHTPVINGGIEPEQNNDWSKLTHGHCRDTIIHSINKEG